MLGQGRFLGRRPAGQRKKRKDLRKSRTAAAIGAFPYPGTAMNPEKKPDPYALPKKDEPEGSRDRKRVILSKDPLIRIMIEDNSDVKYEDLKKDFKSSITSRQSGQQQYAPPRYLHPGYQKKNQSLWSRFLDLRFYFGRNFLTSSSSGHRRKLSSKNNSSSGRFGMSFRRRSGNSNAEAGQDQQPHAHHVYVNDNSSSFRSQGRVTSACLWHAFRAVTVGVLLIAIGITMAILGKHPIF